MKNVSSFWRLRAWFDVLKRAHSAPKLKPVTFNTNRAGDLADTCEPKATDPAASAKQFLPRLRPRGDQCENQTRRSIQTILFSKPAPARAETMKLSCNGSARRRSVGMLSSTDGLFRFWVSRSLQATISQTTPGESGKSSKPIDLALPDALSAIW